MRQLTTYEGDDRNPDWSSDGLQIAFDSYRSGNWDIWVMDADGGNKRQLTTYEGDDRNPDWSSDGRKIAFYV